MPPGVVNVITNAPEDAPDLIEALIAHPAVRRINFTGSTRVGRIIAQTAAKYLKPALLELGGKAPLIVLDDADIDAAVAAAAFGAFMNQGQICMSTERIVLDNKVADAFVAKLATKADSLVAGDPRKGGTPLGSLIGADAVDRIQGLIKDAVSKGARVVAGGRSEGTLMSATVLDHVTSVMRIHAYRYLNSICPGTHRLIAECLRDAGLPPGVVNVITNAPEDAPDLIEALIAHPAVRRINFTGSTRVGRIIAQTAARYLKPALLELGGKAPLIVLDDADIDAAVAAAAFGAFMNQGQICMSTERIVLDNKVADAFVAKLATKANSLVAGDPRKGGTPLGSLIGADAVDRIQGLIKDAVAKGARVVAGGRSEGTLMSATVLDHVTSVMRIYGEESFGPVVSIVRVNSVDEAVRVANDTEYGLSAAVFGRDIARAMEVAKRIESGICHVNGPTVHDEAQMPFGGTKASGYGRFGGKAGIAEFTELRWITIETGPQHYPI